jgi:hypothetical protein
MMTTIFDNIGWELLREQKETLYRMRGTAMPYGKDAIDGILNLLDEFQDVAVAEGYATEEEVFGKDEEE